MQGMMNNPAFVQMAQQIGAQMMQDPAMSSLIAQYSNPEHMAQMKTKFDELKNDPELAGIMSEFETGGPAAMMKYWNDPAVLAKIGKAVGGVGGGPTLGGELEEVEPEEEEEEDEEDEELTLHSAASSGDHEALAVLLKAPGCDVNAADGEGRTALHFACGYGEVRLCFAGLRALVPDPPPPNRTSARRRSWTPRRTSTPPTRTPTRRCTTRLATGRWTSWSCSSPPAPPSC
jgi:predicted component of type VI protein secretion system